MLEPRVIGARVHQIRQSELMYAVKALKLRNLEQRQEDAVQSDAAVDRIVHDLVICQRS